MTIDREPFWCQTPHCWGPFGHERPCTSSKEEKPVTNFDARANLDPTKAYAVVVRHHSEVANLAVTLAFSPDEVLLHLELHEANGWDCSVFYAPGVDLPPVVT